jgi:hypothetical protein
MSPKRVLIGKSNRRGGVGALLQLLGRVKEVERVPQGITGKADSATTIIVKVGGKNYKITGTRVK